MEIIKVYKESLPNLKLVGKRFTNQDRDQSGTFASQWQACFQQGWFFERYNNPRFTKPDEKGNVILDICAYLTE